MRPPGPASHRASCRLLRRVSQRRPWTRPISGTLRAAAGRRSIPGELPVTSVHGGDEATDELADAVGIGVSALEHLAFYLDGDDSVTRRRLNAQFAHLEAEPTE